MRTCAKRRVITVAVAKAIAIRPPARRRAAEFAPVSDPDTMTATPANTARSPPRSARGTRSPKAAQAISAAISGTPACTSRMLATVVCRERHHEGGRGGGEGERHREPGRPHGAEAAARARPARRAAP